MTAMAEGGLVCKRALISCHSKLWAGISRKILSRRSVFSASWPEDLIPRVWHKRGQRLIIFIMAAHIAQQ